MWQAYPGILVFRPKAAIKAILEALILVAELAGIDDLWDQITYTPLK